MMNKDKMLDDLFSSAKEEKSLMNDSEIISLLEESNVPIVKTYFGVKKMNFIYYTAAAVVLGYFGFVNVFEQEANTKLSNPVIQQVNELQQANKSLKEPTNTSIPNEVIEKKSKVENSNITNKDLVKFENKKDEKDGNNSFKVKSEKVELVSNKIKDNEVKEKPSKLIDYIATNVINLNKEEIQNLGCRVDKDRIAFTAFIEGDKETVITLQKNDYNVNTNKEIVINSISPKFVSNKNGKRVISLFDDGKTIAFQTEKSNDNSTNTKTVIKYDDGKTIRVEEKIEVDRRMITSRKEEFNRKSDIIEKQSNSDSDYISKKEDNSDIQFMVDSNSTSIKVLNNEVLKNNFDIRYKVDENDSSLFLNQLSLESDSIIKFNSNGNNGFIFIQKKDTINSNLTNFKLEKGEFIKYNNVVPSDSLLFTRYFKDGSQEHYYIEKGTKYELKQEKNSSLYANIDKNGGKIVIIPNINGNQNLDINSLEKIDLILNNKMKELSENSENTETEIEIQVSNSNQNSDEQQEVLEEKAKLLDIYLKNLSNNLDSNNYFNHDINKLIPIEIKLDGENLDYVLWFEPTLELLTKLPEHLQEKLRSEFEVLQNSESAVCGEAPTENPVSDRWNGCSGAIMNLKLYPIPAKDFINYNFELTENRNLEISFTDINGNKLNINSVQESFNAGSYNKRLDISTLSPGIYYLTIVSDNSEIVNQRFIKE